MASQLEAAQNAPAATKYDRFVQKQLQEASSRVRRLDLLSMILVLLAATLAYAVLILSLDWLLELPSAVRLAAFGLFVLGVLGYLGYQLRALYFLQVNPYFAARQLEKTVPQAKGSVINWLDLHEEPLPSAIRNSLSVRAAQDVSHADIDQAVRNNNPFWLLVLLGVLFIPLLLLFVSGPGQFSTLLGRAFLPFREAALTPNTEIVLVHPKDGNLIIGEKQAVEFRALIQGRVPGVNQDDSPKLYFRYDKADLFHKNPKPLHPQENGEWTVTLASDQIPSPGIYYKIAAGDAETPEYFIKVTSAPLVKKFFLTYQPRSYRAWAKQAREVQSPYIQEYEGTKVVLRIETNRELKSGYLDFVFDDQEKMRINGQLLPKQPQSMLFQFTLGKPGTFTIHFQSKQGEDNVDLTPYVVRTHKDPSPKVELSEPGKDIQLPANGVLPLRGQAQDFDEKHLRPSAGLKNVLVQMRVVKGHEPAQLQPKVYRQGKSLELTGGRHPAFLAYQDFVELSKLKLENGQPFQAKEGMVLEYWLETRDICDYYQPEGNLGKSEVFKVTILPPEEDEKAQEQKQQAEEQQKEHEQQQDENLQQQKQEIEQQQQEQEQQQGQQDQDQEQDQQQQNGPGAGKNGEQKQDPGQGAGEDKKSPEDKKFEDLVNQLEQEKQDDKQEQKDKGQQNPGQAKDDGGKGQQKPEDGSGMDKQQKPDQKPEDGSGMDKQQKQDPGSGMDQQPKAEQKPGDDKKGGEDGSSNNQAKGQGKPSEPGAKENQPDTGKGAGQQQPPQPSAKGGDKEEGGQAGDTDKKQPPKEGEPTPGSAKEKKPDEKMDPSQPKEKPQQPEKGPGSAKGQPDAGKGEPETDPGMKTQPDSSKNGSADPDDKGTAKGGPKDAPKDGANKKEKLTPEEVSELEKFLKEQSPEAHKKFREELEKIDRPEADPKTPKDGQKEIDAKTLKEILENLEKEAKQKNDPKLEDAAKETLKALEKCCENGQGNGQGASQKPGNGGMGQEPGGSDGGMGKKNEEGPKMGEGQGPGDGGKKSPEQADGKAPGKSSDGDPTDGGNADFGKDGKPTPAKQEFADKLGNLQLEQLQEKIAEYKKMLDDPDVQKKLKLTPEQKQWAENHMKQLLDRAKQEQTLPPGAAPSSLGSKGPSQVGGANQKPGQVNIGTFRPPPEYQRAFEKLTTDPNLQKSAPPK